jgi:hypothetical protein
LHLGTKIRKLDFGYSVALAADVVYHHFDFLVFFDWGHAEKRFCRAVPSLASESSWLFWGVSCLFRQPSWYDALSSLSAEPAFNHNDSCAAPVTPELR